MVRFYIADVRVIRVSSSGYDNLKLFLDQSRRNRYFCDIIIILTSLCIILTSLCVILTSLYILSYIIETTSFLSLFLAIFSLKFIYSSIFWKKKQCYFLRKQRALKKKIYNVPFLYFSCIFYGEFCFIIAIFVWNLSGAKCQKSAVVLLAEFQLEKEMIVPQSCHRAFACEFYGLFPGLPGVN